MNESQARRILHLVGSDDFIQIKKKYRLLMGRYHPDVLGEASFEYIHRAQEINEAYQFLKNRYRSGVQGRYQETGADGSNKGFWRSGSYTPKCTGELNDSAFCERNIYSYYSMDVETDGLYYKITRGKYMWDPEEEELHLFISSIHHATKDLLEKIEEKYPNVWCEELRIKEQKFKIQAELFYCLIKQFVHPVETLAKLADPAKEDEEGRLIYRLQAHIGTKGYDKVYKNMAKLQKGTAILPVALKNNKIVVADREKNRLGHLSFEEDSLYFCVIPLLKKKLAQVKLIVNEVQENKKHRPYSVKVTVRVFLRLEKDAQEYQMQGGEQNLKIVGLLNRYEEILRKGK